METNTDAKINPNDKIDEIETSSLARLAYGVSFIHILNIPLFIIIGMTALIVMSIKCQQGYWYLRRGLKFLVLTNILAIPIYYLIWPHYHSDGKRIVGWCLGNEPHHSVRIGTWLRYYPNGNKAWEAFYLFDRRTSSTEWYENGNIYQKIRYNYFKRNNPADGLCKEYFPNGRIRIEANFKDGYQDGEQKEYNESGDLIGVYEYKDGVLIKTKNLAPASPPLQQPRAN